MISWDIHGIWVGFYEIWWYEWNFRRHETWEIPARFLEFSIGKIHALNGGFSSKPRWEHRRVSGIKCDLMGFNEIFMDIHEQPPNKWPLLWGCSIFLAGEFRTYYYGSNNDMVCQQDWDMLLAVQIGKTINMDLINFAGVYSNPRIDSKDRTW